MKPMANRSVISPPLARPNFATAPTSDEFAESAPPRRHAAQCDRRGASAREHPNRSASLATGAVVLAPPLPRSGCDRRAARVPSRDPTRALVQARRHRSADSQRRARLRCGRCDHLTAPHPRRRLTPSRATASRYRWRSHLWRVRRQGVARFRRRPSIESRCCALRRCPGQV